MARITPAGGEAFGERLPLAGGGDSALGLAAAPDLGLPLRDVASSGSGQAWAVVGQLGALVRRADGRWSVPGANDIDRSLRLKLLEALGARELTAAGESNAGLGLRALAFRSVSEGYAVGDDGAIARFDGDAWRAESAAVENDLTDVAVAGTRVLAVGDGGTLLLRAGSEWRPADASALAAGRDFSAAGSATDGTLLAAGEGTLLALDRDRGWHRLPLDPLGVRVVEIAGYRARDGALHVLALVDDGGTRALLDGGPGGWAPVHAGADTTVEDFALDARTQVLSVAGSSGGKAVLVRGPAAEASR